MIGMHLKFSTNPQQTLVLARRGGESPNYVKECPGSENEVIVLCPVYSWSTCELKDLQ